MEENKKWIVILIATVLVIACLALVIIGQRQISIGGLAMQLTGLAGILVMLYLYNKKYQ